MQTSFALLHHEVAPRAGSREPARSTLFEAAFSLPLAQYRSVKEVSGTVRGCRGVVGSSQSRIVVCRIWCRWGC